MFAGAGQDAAGDQAAGSAASRDIRGFSARYDDGAGSIEVTVTLGAAPGAGEDGLLAAFLRRGCDGGAYAVMLDNIVPDAADPGVWRTDSDPTVRPLARGGTAPTVTFAAADFTALAYEGYDCLVVRTTPASGAPYDEARVALAEVAPPPPPPPEPTPQPTPPAQDPPPLGPAPLVRGERLDAALAACNGGKKCRRAARRRFAPSRRERLRSALDACGSRRCKTRARTRFRGVRPAPHPTGLERSLYAYGGSDILGACGGICWEALAFVDRRFVYVGLPEGAGIPDCTKVTYDAEEEQGCARFRVRGRTVRVAGRTYRIGKRARSLVRAPTGDEDEPTTLERQVFPRAGARWDVPVIEAIYVSGSPFVGTQIITQTYLTLTRDGRFVKSSVFFGSSAPGVDPSLTVAGAPPDTKGTYEVLPAGTMRLTYDDGKVELGSAFYWDAAKGRDPNKAGLHVGDDTFFGPPDD